MEKRSRRASKHFVLLRNLMSRYRNKEVPSTDKIHDHHLLTEMFYNPMMDTRKPITAQVHTDDHTKVKDTETAPELQEEEKFQRSKARATNQRTSLRRMKAIRDLKKYFNKLESEFPTNVHHQLYTKSSDSSSEQSGAKHLLNSDRSARLRVDSVESLESNQRVAANVSRNFLNDMDDFLEVPSPIVTNKRKRRTQDLRHAVYERQYEKKLKVAWQPVHTSTPKHTEGDKTKSPCTDSYSTEELLFTFLNTNCLTTACPKTSTPIRQETALPNDYSLIAHISTPIQRSHSERQEKTAEGQGPFKKMKKIRSRLFSDSNNSSVKSYGFV